MGGASVTEGILSLEFGVQYTCPLRARYSEERLRQWGRLSNLHTCLTTGDTSAPSEDKLKWVEGAREEVEAHAYHFYHQLSEPNLREAMKQLNEGRLTERSFDYKSEAHRAMPMGADSVSALAMIRALIADP